MVKRLRPLIRLFVSSTFSDLTEERNALQERVWPELERFCQVQGFQFQAIDLRWGVSSEAGLDHRTMQICLDELRRAQEISPQPNFLILLGDRYGWRPLPEQISGQEYGALLIVCENERERQTLQTWYRLDENSVCVLHLLRSRRDASDGRDYTVDMQGIDTESWLEVQSILWALINRAYPFAHMADRFSLPFSPGDPIPSIVRFQASATEQEIWNGAFSGDDAAEHVIAISRSIHNLSEVLEHPLLGNFVNTHADDGSLDMSMIVELGALKGQLRELLGKNFIDVPHAVELKEQTGPNQACQLQISTDHLDFVCQNVRDRLQSLIQQQIEQYDTVPVTSSSSLTSAIVRELHFEREEQARFAAEREPLDAFLGRDAELTAIQHYIGGVSSKPFVLYGPSGSGKSAVIAAAAREARTQPGAIVIEKYLGTTRHSSDLRSLLTDLCYSLRARFPVADDLPSDIRLLEKEFYTQLQNATLLEPIVIFLDALDQLDNAEDALRLWWIRSAPLPVYVREIVSCVSDADDSAEPSPWKMLNQRGIIHEDTSVALTALSPNDAQLIWKAWQSAAGRTLTESQQAIIDERVVHGAESCRQPLYLKVLFGEAKLWPSWFQPCRPGKSVVELLNRLMDRLSRPESHGPLLEPAVSYLVSARYGLTENELLEILYRDPDYRPTLNQSARHALPRGSNRIPIALWSQLRFDLSPYIAERGAPGGTVLQFFHRQIAEVVRERFVQTPDRKAKWHRRLILYFARQHWFLEPRSEQRKRMTPPYSARPANVRKVTELPKQLLRYAKATPTAEFTPTEQTRETWVSRLLSTLRHKSPERQIEELQNHDEAYRWLERLFKDLSYLEAKNEAGLAFELLTDFEHALFEIPEDRPNRRMLSMLRQALQWEIEFISAHHFDFPQALFQTSWNTCWWHGTSDFEAYYSPPSDVDVGIDEEWPPWHSSGRLLAELMESWRKQKTSKLQNFPWLRALRPPPIHLGTAQTNVLCGHNEAVHCIAISPDGTKIASGSDQSIRIWDRATGQQRILIVERNDVVVLSDQLEVRCLAFSPDGTRLVAGTLNHDLRLWDAENGEPMASLHGHQGSVNSVSWSADGSKIVSASQDGTVCIWDMSGLREAEEFIKLGTAGDFVCKHGDEVTSVAFSADSLKFVTGAKDKTVRIWTAADGQQKCCITPSNVEAFDYDQDDGWTTTVRRVQEVRSVAFSPDGRHVAAGLDDRTIRIYNAMDGKMSHVLFTDHAVSSVAYSTDGTRISAGLGNGHLQEWLVACLPAAKNRFPHKVLVGHNRPVTDVAWSPDGMNSASASFDHTVRLWSSRSETFRAISLLGHTKEITCLAMSLTGELVATAGQDRTIRVWEVASGRERYVLRTQDEVTDLKFSPDGGLIASTSQESVRLWDSLSGHEVGVIYGEHESIWKCLTFFPDGQSILLGRSDGSLRVVQLASGQELSKFNGSGPINSVAVSSNGSRILVASHNCVRILEATNGNEIGRFTPRYVDDQVEVSQDGSRFVTAGFNAVRVWDSVTFKCLMHIEGIADIRAIAAGSEYFPWQARVGESGTTVTGDSGIIVARLPVHFTQIATQRSGRVWAGITNKHLYLFTLENAPDA